MIHIKMLVMDVDGTMTDGSINISSSGELFKSFDVKDGMGIKLLHDNHVLTSIITGRVSDIVSIRARELKINNVSQGVNDKASALKQLMSKYNLSKYEVAYIGDDINDLDAIDLVGLSFCPCDSAISVRERVDRVLQKPGGHGALRECAEIIINEYL